MTTVYLDSATNTIVTDSLCTLSGYNVGVIKAYPLVNKNVTLKVSSELTLGVMAIAIAGAITGPMVKDLTLLSDVELTEYTKKYRIGEAEDIVLNLHVLTFGGLYLVRLTRDGISTFRINDVRETDGSGGVWFELLNRLSNKNPISVMLALIDLGMDKHTGGCAMYLDGASGITTVYNPLTKSTTIKDTIDSIYEFLEA